jgi:BlaI family transcriptional regulator, penicillinase repressor
MEELTKTEERIMQIIWQLEKCFVKDIIEKLDDEPKPPYTTISSVVRILETKGFVGHKAYGKTHEYFPLITREEFGKSSFRRMFREYFEGKPEKVLSFMMEDEKLSPDEIEQLKKFIDKQ